MSVINSNEEKLRQLIFEHDLLIVFYHSPVCEVCKTLLPVFKEYSSDPTYGRIFFVSIDSDENIIPGRGVDKREVPFISLNSHGLLLECKTISDKNELVQSLNKLAYSSAHNQTS